jgi:hypothetical protein
MTIVKNPAVLHWKHPVEGITTKENNNGEIEITGWPASLGAMPGQATVDAWEADFEANEAPKRAALKAMEDYASDMIRLIPDIIDNIPGLLAKLPQVEKDKINAVKTLKAKL